MATLLSWPHACHGSCGRRAHTPHARQPRAVRSGSMATTWPRQEGSHTTTRNPVKRNLRFARQTHIADNGIAWLWCVCERGRCIVHSLRTCMQCVFLVRMAYADVACIARHCAPQQVLLRCGVYGGGCLHAGMCSGHPVWYGCAGGCHIGLRARACALACTQSRTHTQNG